MFPQVFGKYVLERELSRGGMARVILATLRGAGGFEKRLVVKQIRDELAFDQQFVRRFVEEAKTTVALSHPNIVPVYELGVEQGTYFLAMELVEGVSVADLLRERDDSGARRVLTPEEGAYVGVEVCRALDYAHRRMKVVHRDITPRNVMIDEEGQIKLIDFGIAAPALVAGQEILGSPGHMAPEQLDGGQLGPATDIFAVAVLLMEAWTGAAPFRRATPEECAAAVRDVHPKPSEFDVRLAPVDSAIGRAMSVDAKGRQQQASELARELRGFLRGHDVADLARALGDRVRRLRERVDSTPPAPRANGPRSSVASHGDLGTKTFAARDEALKWSSPPPAPDRESGDDFPVPSTRRLDSVNLVAARRVGNDEAPEPSATPRRGHPDDPAMAIPTPLMVDVEDLERIHADIASAREQAGRRQADIPTVKRRRVPPPDKLETIATRPLETPVNAHEPRGRSAEGPHSRSRLRLLASVVVVALVGAGGFAAWRARQSPGPSGGQPATSVSPPGMQPATSAALTAAPVESSRAARPPASVSAAAAAPSATAPSPASSSSSAVAQGKAAALLLGDQGTRVWVDGTSHGECPARVSLEPGTHEVRFTFTPTGESRVERLTVKSAERVTVRADFTSATPTVKIQR